MLYIVNRVCRLAARKMRILLSATFGAVWSVISLIMPKNLHEYVLLFTYLIVGTVMVWIVQGRCSVKSLLKNVMVLYVVTFMMAGCMHMLYYYTYAGFLLKLAVTGNGDLSVFVIVSVFIVVWLLAEFTRKKEYSHKLCSVSVFVRGRQIDMPALIDTGNVLCDPYADKPVCVAGKKHFEWIYDDYDGLKYHIIPFRSVGCDKGLIEVITVDCMYIYYGERRYEITEALIGLSDVNLSSDNEYEMLINEKVMEV